MTTKRKRGARTPRFPNPTTCPDPSTPPPPSPELELDALARDVRIYGVRAVARDLTRGQRDLLCSLRFPKRPTKRPAPGDLVMSDLDLWHLQDLAEHIQSEERLAWARARGALRRSERKLDDAGAAARAAKRRGGA
ncbi:MAG: hypothetical protein KF878_10245 [Planctomycetes bacterium]|nr:hypothetical protein [Planctomycetota bacterium]